VSAIDLTGYTCTYPFFGAPHLNVDEDRTDLAPHRHIHGGFEGTSTGFRFYPPPAARGLTLSIGN
jgi:hypothetical protein